MWEGRGRKRHARTVTAVSGSPSQYVLFISAIYHVIPQAFSGRRRRINLPKRFYSAFLRRQQETDFSRVCPTARVPWCFLLLLSGVFFSFAGDADFPESSASVFRRRFPPDRRASHAEIDFRSRLKPALISVTRSTDSILPFVSETRVLRSDAVDPFVRCMSASAILMLFASYSTIYWQ